MATNSPTTIEQAIERLRQPLDCEDTLLVWDSWRKYIRNGGGGSWPRDAFEAMLSAIDEERDEAASLLESLARKSEPTEAMIEAGVIALGNWPMPESVNFPLCVEEIYLAMLSAGKKGTDDA